MGKGFAVVDKDGIVTGTIIWGGENHPAHCPLPIPEGGWSIELEGEEVERVQTIKKRGQKAAHINGKIVVNDDQPVNQPQVQAEEEPPQASRLFAHNPEDTPLKKARRAKLREIADEVTAARDRGFGETDKYTPSKGLELGRFLDVVLLYVMKELKDDDEIWARNWSTGHQEKVKVKTIIDSLRDGFRLRQALREHEQERREEVETLFNEAGKSDAERQQAIEAVTVPKHLGLDETDTATDVIGKLKRNGK